MQYKGVFKITSYIKKKSKKQEKRNAKELHGKVTPASGAFDFAKGDVRLDMFLIECKYTDKDYYTFKLDIWDKIEKEALNDNLRIPLMQVDIQDKKFMIIDSDVLKEFLDFSNIHSIAMIDIESKSYKFYPDNFNCDLIIFNFFKLPSSKAYKQLVLINYHDFQKILDE
jgi:NADPH-dependent 7-cyano-7-deazaguanine reductase QueF-like protein